MLELLRGRNLKKHMERMDRKGGGTEKTKGKWEVKSHQGANKFDAFVMHGICKQ